MEEERIFDMNIEEWRDVAVRGINIDEQRFYPQPQKL